MFHFEVMFFGLMNAPATFQRMMDRPLINPNFVRVTIDDIVIFSRTKVENFYHLERVLEVLD